MALLPLFDIARNGLLTQQLQLGVAGNNVANVNTPGYSRQRADLGEETPTAGEGGVLIGRGVRVRSVQQVVDPLIERRLQQVLTDQGEQTTRRDRLQSLEQALNDLGDSSLTTQVDAFFNAADALAQNPAGLAERESLLGSAQAVATELNRRSGQLGTLQRSADDTMVQRVSEVNAQLSRIADLNVQIASAELGGQNAGALRDERNLALQSVSKVIGIDTLDQADGTVRVSAKNGVTLVDTGQVVHQLALQGGATGLDGRVLHDVGLTGSDGSGFIAAPGAIASGEMAALRTVRDQDIVTASTNLDQFTSTLATAVNGVQQNATAVDLDGASTTAVPLFAGTTAGTIAVAVTDPRRIAAARSTQPGDAQNALALADLRSATQAGLGGLTPSGWLASEQSRLGQAASQASDVARSSELLATQVQSERDSVSGVNLNEELTNLIQYQHAFEAAAKLVSVADGVLQTLVDMVQ